MSHPTVEDVRMDKRTLEDMVADLERLDGGHAEAAIFRSLYLGELRKELMRSKAEDVPWLGGTGVRVVLEAPVKGLDEATMKSILSITGMAAAAAFLGLAQGMLSRNIQAVNDMTDLVGRMQALALNAGEPQ